MKKFILCFLLLFTLCCHQPNYPSSSNNLTSHLNNSTVALFDVTRDSVYCSGVWINESQILTAAHCVEDDFGSSSEIITYKTYQEFTGNYPDSFIETLYHAKVVGFDNDNDLAVLESLEDISHDIATIYPTELGQGTPVQTVGHPLNLEYTYTTGNVSRLREMVLNSLGGDQKRLVYHLNLTILPGSSGGGTFDMSGNVIGINSFYVPKAPGFGFVVSNLSIIKFLEENKIKYYL